MWKISFCRSIQKSQRKATKEVVFQSNLNSAILAVPEDAKADEIKKYINDPDPKKTQRTSNKHYSL